MRAAPEEMGRMINAGRRTSSRDRASGRKVIRAVAEIGRASRADVVRATGLARSTVYAVIDELVGDGVLVVIDAPEVRSPKGGRPPTEWFSVVPDAGFVMGVDMGHRWVCVGLADLSQRIEGPEGLPAAREAQGDIDSAPRQAFDTVAGLITDLLNSRDLSPKKLIGIGVSIPAAMSLDGQVAERGMPAWDGEFRDPVAALRQRLPRWADDLPIYADNDANLGLLGEIANGTARNATDAIYVRASQGIGAGLLMGGQIQRGRHGFAGELGHVPIRDGSGPVCFRCGTSCIEVRASTPALLRILEPTHGKIDGDALLTLASEGDAAAGTVLRDAGQTIGLGLVGICNALDPGLVIIGGQLGQSDLVVDSIRSTLRGRAFAPIAEGLTVTPSELGTSAQLHGAVSLVLERVPRGSKLAAALRNPAV